MPISSSELVLLSCASRPENDTSASGGAIDATRRPSFIQLSTTSALTIASDGADTRSLTVKGRVASGALDTETIVLNGTSNVVGTKVFERIHSADLSTADASRTVTVKQGSTTLATIPPNEVGFLGLFINAAAEATATVRYEKVFWKNKNASLALSAATVTLTADPDSKIKIGLAPTVNDSVSVSNRKSAPSSVTFVDDGVAQNIPGVNLNAGSAIGTWIQQSLDANNSPLKGNFTTKLEGQSI